MQNEVSWYFFIKKYQRDLVLLKENIIFFLRNWPTIRIIRKPKNIKNTGNYFISDGVGGGFLGEFSVAWIIFFNAFIHHEFFFWSIFLQQMFFFSASNMEKLTTIHYYSIQFRQRSHISERFRVGVGTKRSKLSPAVWEFNVVLEIENPGLKKIGPT